MSDKSKNMKKLSPGEKFTFDCHRELECFNRCCSDVNIFLTPYDVLRMRKTLWISSGEFLKNYTVSVLGDDGLPYVLLRMVNDEKKSCPFLGQEGCSIYENRPWSCRMYPVFPAPDEEQTYLVEEKPSCLGSQADREWTVEEWKENQGVEEYEKMNSLYNKITCNKFFESGGRLDRQKARLLYRACYDLDEFRKFLFAWRFVEAYDLDPDTLRRLELDDEELLLFGYKWVRFNLFNEDVLRIKSGEKYDALRAMRGK